MMPAREKRRSVFRRLGQVFQLRSTPRDVKREVDAELDYHFSRQVDVFIKGGMSQAEAEREAHRRFGDVSQHRARLGRIGRQRESMERRAQWWGTLRDNIRYGVRGLRQSPGFTATVVTTFALGIGANATMFDVIDRLLLSPPAGVADPDDVRRIYLTRTTNRGAPSTSQTLTYPSIADWAEAGSFEVASFQDRALTLGRGNTARRVPASVTSANFFDLLGVIPQLGRYFTDEEDLTQAAVVVISDLMWRQEFRADPEILGRELVIGGAEVIVAGVAPPGFVGINLGRVDIWLPLRSPVLSSDPASWETSRTSYWLRAVARVTHGDNVEAAEAEATALYRGAHADMFFDPGTFVSLTPLVTAQGPGASDESNVARWLTGVSAVVLLIACANVANLLLARSLRRRREIGVRLALGVSRSRLVTQLVTESLQLSILGGLGALAVAYWGAEIMRAVLLPDVHWPTPPLSLRILYFTVAASIGAGLIAGVVPALQSTRPNYLDVLRSGGRGSTLPRSRTRSGLLVVQTALSTLLLVGAGLFVRSLHEVHAMDLGIDPDRAVLVLPEISSDELTGDKAALFYRNAVEKLTNLPGVESVAASEAVPFRSSRAESLRIPGRDALPMAASGDPFIVEATPGVFEALDLRIIEGRGFLPHEDGTTAPVAVVDETMAKLVWPGESPLGKCLLIGEAERLPCNEVVGVVENSRVQLLIEGDRMQYFVPLGQSASTVPRALFVRAAPESFEALIPEIRRELLAMSSAVRFVVARPYRDYIDPQARSWSLGATMFTLFGALALVIATVGLYGVLAFNVVQRTHELGVRKALGATPERLVCMVLDQAMRTTGLGLGVGLLGALAVGYRIAPLLFNVSVWDPLVLGAVILTLNLVAAAAAILPAWRTTQIDPNAAFRVE